MRRRFALATSACLALLFPCLECAAQNHPQQIEVNSKSYQWPRTPVVVILIDGGDPQPMYMPVWLRASFPTSSG